MNTMKKLILMIASLVSLNVQANADHDPIGYCEWLGDTTLEVVQNRDAGIEKYDFINKYLAQGNSYGEQTIVLSIVDNVYGQFKYIKGNALAIDIKTQCLHQFVGFAQ